MDAKPVVCRGGENEQDANYRFVIKPKSAAFVQYMTGSPVNKTDAHIEQGNIKVKSNLIIYVKNNEIFTSEPDGADARKIFFSGSLPGVDGNIVPVIDYKVITARATTGSIGSAEEVVTAKLLLNAASSRGSNIDWNNIVWNLPLAFEVDKALSSDHAVIWFYNKNHTPVTNHDQYNAYRTNAKIELVVDSIGRRIDFIYSTNEENWLEEIRYEVTVREEHKFLLSGFKNPLQRAGRSYNFFINLTDIYSNYTHVRGNEIYKNRVVFEYNSPSRQYKTVKFIIL